MPTNLELQAVIKGHEKTIKELEERIEQLDKQANDREAMINESKGLSGFVVTTPNANYSGVTYGIMFRNGRGIVLDGPEAARIINALRNDFGYTVTHSDNLQSIGGGEAAVEKSMIDVLSR